VSDPPDENELLCLSELRPKQYLQIDSSRLADELTTAGERGRAEIVSGMAEDAVAAM
jgi:hypothetical protein